MTLICRKCIARRTRVKGFFDHRNDDEYWRDALYEEEWEWHAWRLTEDFEDESVLQVDLRRMLDEKLKVEDYNKLSAQELSDRFSVRYIAQGTLWKMNDVFQLTVEFYDSKDDKVIWSDRWQENWTNLSNIKSLLASGLNEILNKKGIGITLVDARFAKPLDENLIWEIATNHEAIITIEEGSLGGFGSHVSQFLSEKKLLDNNLKFRSMILTDKFIDHNKPELMYKEAGLDAEAIVSKVFDVLNSKIIVQKQN